MKKVDIKPAVDPTIVDLLEDLLQKAREGEIGAMGIVVLNHKGDVTTAYSLGQHKFGLIGGASGLHKRILETTGEGNQG